jgi:hypothetical protein
MSAFGRVSRLARVDVLRMVRKYTDTNQGVGKVISLVVFVLASALVGAGGGYLAYLAARSGVTGDVALGPLSAMAALRGALAVFGLACAVVVVVRAVGQRGTLTNSEGVLTVVTTGQAFLGLLVAEFLYALLWLAAPAVGVGVGLAVGLGSPTPLVTVPLGAAALAATAVALGVPVGLGLRHVASRIAFVARNRALVAVAAFVVYLALVFSGSLNALVLALFEPMQSSPTGWVADLSLVGTPLLEPTPGRAAGAVVVTAAVAVVGGAAGSRLAAAHWFSDPVLAGEEADAARDEPTADGRVAGAVAGVERRLVSTVGAPTAALVTLAWRRALRAPLKLLYVLYPLLFAVGAIADIFQTGRIPAYLPYGTVLFVAWAAGVVFTLNPLGDQGAGLPVALLSRVDGRRFVRAHVLASLLVAVPLGTVLTALVAVASPLDAARTLGLAAAAPALIAAATVLSVGLGTAFPRFRAVNITRSMKTVVPSTFAFVLFTLYLVSTAAAALLLTDELARQVAATLLSVLLPFGLGVTPGTLAVVAGVGLAGLVLAVPLSYRHAVSRFDGYTLD